MASTVNTSLLTVLCYKQDIGQLQVLLDSDPDAVKQQQKGGRAPAPLVSIAVDLGNVELMKLLVKYGADTENRDSRGRVPLYTAATKGDLDMVKSLVEVNADKNAKHISGNTPFQGAIVHNQFVVGEYLIDIGSDVDNINNGGDTSLHLAAQQNALSIAKMLIERTCDVNAVKSRCRQRRHHGAGITPLHVAAYFNHPQMIELLLKNGAYIEKTTEVGLTALHSACSSTKSQAALQTLIRYGSNLDTISDPELQPRTALMIAIDKHNPVDIETLIFAGADVHGANKFGVTPLVKAIFSRSIEILYLLLQNGAKLYVKLHNCQSPLVMAVDRNLNIDAAVVLLASGYRWSYFEYLQIKSIAKFTMKSEQDVSTRKKVIWIENYCRSPQTLVNCCRLLIRECLSQCSFQFSVGLLPLPNYLKNVVLCTDLKT